MYYSKAGKIYECTYFLKHFFPLKLFLKTYGGTFTSPMNYVLLFFFYYIRYAVFVFIFMISLPSTSDFDCPGMYHTRTIQGLSRNVN